jgi:hypothetical protein
MGDPLKVRLFGYGVPYRVGLDSGGGVEPMDTDAVREADTLYRSIRLLKGLIGGSKAKKAGGEWAYSMPFGRCGVEGLPREHLVVHFSAEAYLDVLSADGLKTHRLQEGEIAHIEPGTVVRLRALPLEGHRVLVAFQTEDRTPLVGNAGPFTLDGVVPDDWRERLVTCHGAFAEAAEQAKKGWHRPLLERFFGKMADVLAGHSEIAAIQAAAREQGSYDIIEEQILFDRQRELLDEAALERIKAQDEAVFRFPGMFGGVAPLFNLID